MVRADRTKLSGTIEVDETYIGGEEHSGSTGRWTGNKVLVAIAVDNHIVHIQSKKNEEENPLPHVHLLISLLKRWLLGTHQGAVSDKYMQAYLEEYAFRFNRRNAAKRGLLFYRLLEGAVNISPHTYEDIVNMHNDF